MQRTECKKNDKMHFYNFYLDHFSAKYFVNILAKAY